MNPKKEHVVVVDDEEGIRETSRRLLERQGFEVTTCVNGEEAVAYLQKHPADMVISDLRMPKVDGLELLAWVQQHQPQVPVVIATAHGTVETAVKALKSGAVDYLLKPFDAEDLIFTVKRCLHERSQDRRIKELEELNRLKSEFVSNVSHELRTPLSAMGGALELLAQDWKDQLTGVQKQLFNVVINDFERLAHVIRNVLDFSRLETGKMKIVPQKVSMNQVVTRALHELSPLINTKKGLLIKTEISEDPHTITADREQLFQVFTNLLDNAIKFSDAGRAQITIRVEDQGDHVLCCVQDTGIGIAPEHREKVFERFYQVDGSPTRAVGGTGIGLAIVKAIIENHGGSIWVEPAAPQGSCFKFKLPKIQGNKP